MSVDIARDTSRDKNWQFLSYSLSSLPLAAMLLTIFVYLPKFLIEELSLGPGLVGIGLILVKSMDLVLDPLVGTLTDKLKARGFGFKKFIFLSFVPFSLFYLSLFFLPQELTPQWMFLLCFCLLYTSPSPRDKRQSRMPSSA